MATNGGQGTELTQSGLVDGLLRSIYAVDDIVHLALLIDVEERVAASKVRTDSILDRTLRWQVAGSVKP